MDSSGHSLRPFVDDISRMPKKKRPPKCDRTAKRLKAEENKPSCNVEEPVRIAIDDTRNDATVGTTKETLENQAGEGDTPSGDSDIMVPPNDSTTAYLEDGDTVGLLKRIIDQHKTLLRQNSIIISQQQENEIVQREATACLATVRQLCEDVIQKQDSALPSSKPMADNASYMLGYLKGSLGLASQIVTKLDATYEIIYKRSQAHTAAQPSSSTSGASCSNHHKQPQLPSSSDADVPLPLVDLFIDKNLSETSAVRGLVARYRPMQSDPTKIMLSDDPFSSISVAQFRTLLSRYKKPQRLLLNMLRAVMVEDLQMDLTKYRVMGSSGHISLKSHPVFKGILAQVCLQYPDFKLGPDQARSVNDFCRSLCSISEPE